MWLLSMSVSQAVVAKTLKSNSIHIKKLKDTHIIKNEEKMGTRISVYLTTLYITCLLL